MESPSPLISWVNPFPSRFINRTIFFCDALESHECACCLLSFLYFHWLFPLLARETSSGNRACVGDGGSIWCLVDPRPCTLGLFRASETNLRNKLNGLRIPTGRRQTSWLRTSAAEALNQGLLETNPNPNHSTTLPPSSLLLAATYMKWILIESHLCKRDRFLWDFLYNNIYHGSSRLFCGTCDLRRTAAVVLQETIKMQ